MAKNSFFAGLGDFVQIGADLDATVPPVLCLIVPPDISEVFPLLPNIKD